MTKFVSSQPHDSTSALSAAGKCGHKADETSHRQRRYLSAGVPSCIGQCRTLYATLAPAGVSSPGREGMMKTHYTIALAMLAGFGLGTVAVQGLHAQSKPPVYQVTELEILDPVAYSKDYAPKARAAIEAAGGKFLALGGKTTALASSSSNGTVLRKSRPIASQRPSKNSCRSATNWRNSAPTLSKG